MDPCGNCEACVQVHAGTHPDVVRVSQAGGQVVHPAGTVDWTAAMRGCRQDSVVTCGIKPLRGTSQSRDSWKMPIFSTKKEPIAY